MFLMVVITVLFFSARHAETNNELIQLIERIHLEGHSATVCFIAVEGDFLKDFMSEHSYFPIMYFSSFQSDGFIGVSFSNLVLVFNDSDKENRQNFDSLQLLVNRISPRQFVIITTNSFENLREFFDFFGKNGFTRIFGIIDNVPYVFFPYASVKIRHVNKDGGLPHALTDLTNFTFRTTIQNDYPRAFRYTDSNGQSRIGGRIGLTFVNFIRRHNATFKEIVLNSSVELNIPSIIDATQADNIDISMNAYGIIKGLDMSYPLKFETWNIMVPINGHLDPYEYFQRPFSTTVWICIALTLIYITAIEVTLNICTGLRPNVWQSFSQAFLIILGRPLESSKTSTYYRINCLVFLFSFIIGNLYNIYFTSFLTVFINVKQYDAIQDLLDNKVFAMIPHFELALLTDFQNYPNGLEEILLPVKPSVFLAEMHSMRNTSFAYTVSGDRCEFLIRLQSFCEKPLFRKARESLSEYYVGFLLPQYSPFKEILDNFIFDIQQTGLMLKWEADAAYQSLHGGHPVKINRVIDNNRRQLALTLHHLQFGFCCLTLGLMLGLVAFACELSTAYGKMY